MKHIVHTPDAPKPIGPYSQAVVAGKTLYASGQIALDPVTGNLLNSDLQTETSQVLKNIDAVLKEAGFKRSDVVKCTIFLSDMSLFAEVNEIYAAFFSDFHPARETVAVKALPMGVNVEISATAVKD